MGCGPSKSDDLPLINFCKHRKELMKSAAHHRFSLAAAHIEYFRHLQLVGESLCRFVEEELIVASNSSSSISSPSSLASPVLTIPSEKKKKRKKKKGSSTTSISHNLMEFEGENEDEHLHLSSEEEEEDVGPSGHMVMEEEEEEEEEEDGQKREKVKSSSSPQPGISYIPESQFSFYPNYNNDHDFYSSSSSYFNNNNNPYYDPENGFGYSGPNLYGSRTSYTTYFMRKASTRIPSVIYEEPNQEVVYSFNGASMGQTGYPNYGYGMNGEYRGQQQRRPPTPPSPKVSAWDYFNPFESGEGGGYSGYYGMGVYGYGYGSNTSSPDSREVREREGIPDLEEETESEVIKESYNEEEMMKKKKNGREENSFPRNGKKTVRFEDVKGENKKSDGGSDEGVSKGVGPPRVPVQHWQREETMPEGKESGSIVSSPETEDSVATSVEDVFVKTKGVSFEMEGSGNGSGSVGGNNGGGGGGGDIESLKPSSTTTLSTHGTRDLREVVREIKDEFEAATDYGKEVSVLLEVGKEPYNSRSSLLKGITYSKYSLRLTA